MTSTLDLIQRFLPYLHRVRDRALLAAFIALVAPAASIAILWLVKIFTDDVLVNRDVGLLPLCAIGFLVLSALKVGLDYAETLIEASIVERIFLDIRADLYSHLMRLSPGSLRKRGVGDLLAHLSDDVERAELLVFTGIMAVIADAALVIYFVIFLFYLSWELTLSALLVVPVLVLASARLAPRVRRASRIARHKASSWMDLAEERLGAGAVVHAFHAHDAETEAFLARQRAARKAELRAVWHQAWLSAVVDAAIAVGGLLVFLVGAYQILYGGLTLGTLAAFVGSIGSLYDPVRSLGKAVGRFQRGAAGAQRVADLFDTPSLVTESPVARPLQVTKGALSFRDIRFTYPRGPEILKGVSLDVRPGEMVALVGPSGSGKSTLVRLALRLCDPAAGSVLIDEQDLRDVTLNSLRRAVAVVYQEPFLMRASVAENIRYGRPGAADEAVQEAGRAAYVDAFLVPGDNGYAAPVGPRGDWLSAGQRQRVALARALVRQAPILLLDEATASVDSETEELIQDAVENLAGARTILVVAHRLSSVRRADRVVVLDGGRIVESGPPAVLLRHDSRCRDLFAAQLVSEGAPA